jgi:HEPN domain-containing protein
MSDIKHANFLLNMAAKDLKALEGMQDSDRFAEEIYGFHAQQAVEKILKAWIAFLGLEYPLTHNIARLLAILEDQGESVQGFWDLVEYNPYAVEFRYGGFELEDAPLNRPLVIHQVQNLFNQVREIIPSTNLPA